MNARQLVSDVTECELEGFLTHAEMAGHLVVKVGGTAMTDIMEKGKNSAVLAGIHELCSKFGKKVVFVVSAPGKYRNPLKITGRLLKILEHYKQGTIDEGNVVLESLRDDHRSMITDVIADERKTQLLQAIENEFIRLRDFLIMFRTEGVVLPPGLVLDFVAGFGEKIAAMILAEIVNGTYVPLDATRVNSAGEDGQEKSLGAIIDEFSEKIAAALREDTNPLNIAPGFPGFLDGKGTLEETGMGYSDFTAVMAAPENGCLILFKQSGAILQTNPRLLPSGTEISKIRIMPIRQAVRMTQIIGDQIQVIHPMALEVAQKKGLTLMVVDEMKPFSGGGTLILPDQLYDEYQAEQASSQAVDKLPMIGVAEDAYETTLSFQTPAGERRQETALQELRKRIIQAGGKIAHKEFCRDESDRPQIKIIVSGLEDSSKIGRGTITDVEDLHSTEKGFIIGISGIACPDLDTLAEKIVTIFGGKAKVFHKEKSEKLFSVGILVQEHLEPGQREEKLRQIMELVNSHPLPVSSV